MMKEMTMVVNTGFNEALKNSGMSMYALAKRSGIPYTTINELHNNKNDINLCAAATVWRLAAALGVPADHLINSINYLDGVSGKYKGIDYIWSTGADGNSQITFEYEGESVTLNAGAFYNIPSRIQCYNIFAGWMIKEFLDKKEWERQVQAIAGRLKQNER